MAERPESAGQIYVDTVSGLVQYVFLFGSFCFLIGALAALADVLLGLGWGFTWITIPEALGAALVSYGMSIILKRIRAF